MSADRGAQLLEYLLLVYSAALREQTEDQIWWSTACEAQLVKTQLVEGNSWSAANGTQLVVHTRGAPPVE